MTLIYTADVKEKVLAAAQLTLQAYMDFSLPYEIVQHQAMVVDFLEKLEPSKPYKARAFAVMDADSYQRFFDCVKVSMPVAINRNLKGAE